jgi:uncharacterized protein (DUF362 family)
MAVVAVSKNKNPYRATTVALELIINEIRQRLPERAVVKPNVLSEHKDGCVVTDPRICEATVDFLRAEGVEDFILAEGTTDSKVKGKADTMVAFERHGFSRLGEKWTMLDLNFDEPAEWFEIYSPGLNYRVELSIAKTVASNYTTSAAKFKTHDVLGLTLSLKNMMGSICAARDPDTGQVIARGPISKTYMHGFGERQPQDLTMEQNIGPSKLALAVNLIRMAKRTKPSLAIIDGVTAMEGDGPIYGSRKELGVVLAGVDPVAVDTVAAYIAGFEIRHTGYIYVSGLRGVGENRLDEIEVVGEKLEEIRSNFTPHKLFSKAKITDEEIVKLEELTV